MLKTKLFELHIKENDKVIRPEGGSINPDDIIISRNPFLAKTKSYITQVDFVIMLGIEYFWYGNAKWYGMLCVDAYEEFILCRRAS